MLALAIAAARVAVIVLLIRCALRPVARGWRLMLLLAATALFLPISR